MLPYCQWRLVREGGKARPAARDWIIKTMIQNIYREGKHEVSLSLSLSVGQRCASLSPNYSPWVTLRPRGAAVRISNMIHLIKLWLNTFGLWHAERQEMISEHLCRSPELHGGNGPNTNTNRSVSDFQLEPIMWVKIKRHKRLLDIKISEQSVETSWWCCIESLDALPRPYWDLPDQHLVRLDLSSCSSLCKRRFIGCADTIAPPSVCAFWEFWSMGVENEQYTSMGFRQESPTSPQFSKSKNREKYDNKEGKYKDYHVF